MSLNGLQERYRALEISDTRKAAVCNNSAITITVKWHEVHMPLLLNCKPLAIHKSKTEQRDPRPADECNPAHGHYASHATLIVQAKSTCWLALCRCPGLGSATMGLL